MAQDTDAMTEAQIATIVVDADDIVEAMRRNWRDEDEQRSHVLRVSPPFEGEVTAKPHVDEAHSRYPSDITRPIHLSPEAFVAGHDYGARHPDFENGLRYPDMSRARSQFVKDRDLEDEFERRGKLTDEQSEAFDDYWETVLEVWEDRFRGELADDITLTRRSADGTIQETTVAVRYE